MLRILASYSALHQARRRACLRVVLFPGCECKSASRFSAISGGDLPPNIDGESFAEFTAKMGSLPLRPFTVDLDSGTTVRFLVKHNAILSNKVHRHVNRLLGRRSVCMSAFSALGSLTDMTGPVILGDEARHFLSGREAVCSTWERAPGEGHTPVNNELAVADIVRHMCSGSPTGILVLPSRDLVTPTPTSDPVTGLTRTAVYLRDCPAESGGYKLLHRVLESEACSVGIGASSAALYEGVAERFVYSDAFARLLPRQENQGAASLALLRLCLERAPVDSQDLSTTEWLLGCLARANKQHLSTMKSDATFAFFVEQILRARYAKRNEGAIDRAIVPLVNAARDMLVVLEPTKSELRRERACNKDNVQKPVLPSTDSSAAKEILQISNNTIASLRRARGLMPNRITHAVTMMPMKIPNTFTVAEDGGRSDVAACFAVLQRIRRLTTVERFVQLAREEGRKLRVEIDLQHMSAGTVYLAANPRVHMHFCHWVRQPALFPSLPSDEFAGTYANVALTIPAYEFTSPTGPRQRYVFFLVPSLADRGINPTVCRWPESWALNADLTHGPAFESLNRSWQVTTPTKQNPLAIGLGFCTDSTRIDGTLARPITLRINGEVIELKTLY